MLLTMIAAVMLKGLAPPVPTPLWLILFYGVVWVALVLLVADEVARIVRSRRP